MKLWNRIEQIFKRRGLGIFEKWLDRGVVSPNLLNLYAIRRILVVRQHDQLGDFLLSTPVLRALRQFFKHAHIAVLARSYTAEAAYNNQYLDEVIVFPEKGYLWTPAKLWRLVRGLRRGWDLAIVLNTVSHSLTSDLLAYFSGARYILGSEHRVFPGCQRNFFYNLVARHFSQPKHQTERNLDIVRHLGIDTNDRTEVMTLTTQEQLFARNFLRQHGLAENDVVVALHPGAGKTQNRWPVEKFAEMAVTLHRRFAVRLILTWGPKEKDLGSDLRKRLTFDPIVLQDLSLRQLAALLAHIDVFVCNDTGVMHLAAAVGTPLVAIFGPTDPNEWKPIGKKFIAVRGEKQRCDTVSVQQVLQAIHSLLGPKLIPRREPPEEALSPSTSDLMDDDTQDFPRKFVRKQRS
ncbi:MAG: glycosyltransferase family 9 protein [candidate division KSB1 bacterium]|nr:glycosyltransferase family 9 protein [candidate division KSB1 bacterium]MDZ7301633.1 glycosyltransferase family 9 protein [candidate division KSB1 bacterium]MDZ7313506.1 glycosyltransferase family 9 protein [candidate division KSB1 bacterium]